MVTPNPSAPPLPPSPMTIISPEGAAALLWKDSGLAQMAAETMKITAPDLFDLDVVDEVVKEPFVNIQTSLVICLLI